MADRSKRQKASDVLVEHPRLLAPLTSSFSKAFPEIKTIKLVVEEQDCGNTVGTYHFGTGHLPGEFLDCRNPRCYNGGYGIGQTLRFMVASRDTHYEDHRSCRGYEGSPKGRKRYGPCDHSFNVVIDLEFNEPPSTVKPTP